MRSAIETFLKNRNKLTEIIALGGIKIENVEKAMEMGFDGIAILGTIWQETDFKNRLETCKKILTKFC